MVGLERCARWCGLDRRAAGELALHRHLLVDAYADGDTLTAVTGAVDIIR